MARIHDAIKARAAAHAGLSALIGTSPVRMFPTEAPQKVDMPYVVFSQVSGARAHVMNSDKLAQPRIQMDCFATDRIGALNLRDQVLAAFDRWSGVFAGVTVQASVCESEGIDVQRDETLIPRVTLEFTMSYLL